MKWKIHALRPDLRTPSGPGTAGKLVVSKFPTSVVSVAWNILVILQWKFFSGLVTENFESTKKAANTDFLSLTRFHPSVFFITDKQIIR